MPRKGQRKEKPGVGDPSDPDGLFVAMTRHLAALRMRNYSEQTIEGREDVLRRFVGWCDEHGLRRPGEVTKPILERYQRHLGTFPGRGGKLMTFRSQYVRLQHVKGFFRWLARQDTIVANPAAELEMPKRELRLPAAVLSVEEEETVLASMDVRDAIGVRDRVIVEMLYGTGIRRMEVGQLRIEDVDEGRGTLAVRQGKGKRDRLVPLGERTLSWVEKYRREVRPELVVGRDSGVLFVTREGEAMTKNRLTQLVRDAVIASGIGKRGACHLFRHTAATLMLENGADVRMVQEMLGHARLETTQISTHVSIRKLQEVHAATHPGAKLGRRAQRTDEAEREGGEARLDELVEALAAEAREEGP